MILNEFFPVCTVTAVQLRFEFRPEAVRGLLTVTLKSSQSTLVCASEKPSAAGVRDSDMIDLGLLDGRRGFLSMWWAVDVAGPMAGIGPADGGRSIKITGLLSNQ